MSAEIGSGPRVIDAAADQLIQCPQSVLDPTNFTSFVEDGDLRAAERVRYFAMARVISDRLAANLPKMEERFPPYGLPELYRDPDMESPEWRGITVFKPETNHDWDNPQFCGLHDAYVSKMIVHTYDEFDVMYEDPALRPVIEELSVHRMPGYHINSGTTPEEAHDRLEGQVSNAIDVMIGLEVLLPKVAEPEASHDDLIAILKSSKRIVMQLSTISFKQLQAFLIETTEKPAGPRPWGWNFDAQHFQIDNTDLNNPRLSIAEGLRNTPVTTSYRLDFGPDGHALVPTVKVIDDTKTPVSEMVQDLPYGCPALELTNAMWDDIVDLTDKFRLYEY